MISMHPNNFEPSRWFDFMYGPFDIPPHLQGLGVGQGEDLGEGLGGARNLLGRAYGYQHF